VTNLRVPAADPAVIDRALKRALAESEPLADGKAEAVIGTDWGARLLRSPQSRPTAALVVAAVLRLSPFVVEASGHMAGGGHLRLKT
jgi:hypothetical protein